MKITSVEIFPNADADKVTLSFRDPKALNEFNVKSILGLDADTITQQFYGSYGSFNFYNLMLQDRVIVIKVGLKPNVSQGQSYSDLRDHFYKMIASSRQGLIRIDFLNAEVTQASVQGYISKLETPQFEKLQEIQITVNCNEPFLKSLFREQLNSPGYDPSVSLITDNRSTAPHGFNFLMDVLINSTEFLMGDPGDPTWQFNAIPVGGFQAGDIIVFSSEFNNKELSIVRGSSYINIADSIVANSIWPIMFPGDNRFSITDPTHFSWNTISWYSTYWGV